MRWMLFVLLSLFIFGCHYRDPSIDLLEGELRWMEDQLYMMEGELEGACRELGRCQDAKAHCVERNRELNQSNRVQPNHDAASSASETKTQRPRIVMPFQADSEDSAQPVVELPGEPVVELPAEPVVVIPDESAAPVQSGVLSNEWEIIPSVPDSPVPPLPETLFEESDPFVDEGVVPTTDLPVEPDLSVPSGGDTDVSVDEPALGPAGTDESEEDNPGSVTGIREPGAEEKQPTLAEPQPETQSDDIPSLFPESEGDGLSPPTGIRPLLPGDDEPAQPDENDVSIRLLSHLEHVRESRTKPKGKIDAHVTHIVCESHRTPTGISVLVEPRNADGDFVGLPGQISIVVLDEEKSGEQARVSRWDTSAEESAGKLVDSLMSQGIRLEYEWPGSVPFSENLQIYIRYVTVDGRRVQAQQRLGRRETNNDEPLKLSSDLVEEEEWKIQDSGSEFDVVSTKGTGWSVVRRDRQTTLDTNSWGQASDVGQTTIVSNFETPEADVVPSEPRPFRSISKTASRPMTAKTAPPVSSGAIVKSAVLAKPIPEPRLPLPLNEIKEASDNAKESASKVAPVVKTPSVSEKLGKANKQSTNSPAVNKPLVVKNSPAVKTPRLVEESANPKMPSWRPERN